MSDTDDTDLLVRIPANFFSVDTSDSEDSQSYLQRSFEHEYKQDVERLVVNDLLNQVNNLENRICTIEQQGNTANHSFETFEYSSPQSKSAQFGGSLDNLKNYTPNYIKNTPIKVNSVFSLPNTPNYRALGSGPLPVKRYTPESTNTLTMSHVKPVESGRGSSNANPNNTSNTHNGNHTLGDSKKRSGSKPRYNKEMMEEIDQFLENIKKSPQIRRPGDRSREEHLYKCGELSSSVPDLSFGLRDFNSLPVREEPVVPKHFAPLQPKMSSNDLKHPINLPEVKTLLKEIEDTQNQIEQKLRMKEAQFGKGDSGFGSGESMPFPRRPSLCGDNIGSVPDLGFGIRDCKSDTKTKDKRVPVHEDRVIKRSMSLCGVNPGDLTNNSSGSNYAAHSQQSAANVSKGFVPRKLELGGNSGSIPDLGFGLKSWYKSNEETDDRSKTSQESTSLPAGPYLQGDNPSSIPDLGFGLRGLWGSPSAVSTQSGTNTLSASKFNLQSQGHGDPANAHRTPVADAPCKKKVEISSESGPRDSLVVSEEYGAGKIDPSSSSSNLLSLSNLWGNQKVPANSNNDPTNLVQKLEEEKYRREHCERLILQLQSRLLEEQQKLAVAVQVDTGKDQAIHHFHGAWFRLVSHWKELEEQRHNLALQLQSEREQYESDVGGTAQTLKRYESEVSQAFDLAYGYKQKVENIESEMRAVEEKHRREIEDLRYRIQEKEKAVEHTHHESSQLFKEKDDILKRMRQQEDESKKDKTLLLNAKKELDKKVKTIETLEAECTSAKEERSALQLSLKEERGRNTTLDQQMKALRTALDENKKKEKSLRDEIKDSSSQVEKLKSELRAFYQEQVEIVVRDKLNEFQHQLDDAEKSLRHELETREQAITEMAAKQIKQVTEKLQLEVRLLEEKHKEELQLYQMKLGQSTHYINKLQSKLKVHTSRKGEIAEQLHGVMENQWQQVLGILQGNSSMSQLAATRIQTGNAVNNFGTWPKQNSGSSQTVTNPSSDRQLEIPSLQISQQSVRSSSTDDIPFGKEGKLTYRLRQEEPNDELKNHIEMVQDNSFTCFHD